jgi:hypothetical protein
VHRFITALFLLCSMACAHAPVVPPSPVVTLPQGPGTFARDGPRAIEQVANACIDPNTGLSTGALSIEVSASGTIGSHRVDAPMRAALGSGLRVEVPNVRGAPTVLAVSSDNKATLLLPSGGASRVLRGTSF